MPRQLTTPQVRRVGFATFLVVALCVAGCGSTTKPDPALAAAIQKHAVEAQMKKNAEEHPHEHQEIAEAQAREAQERAEAQAHERAAAERKRRQERREEAQHRREEREERARASAPQTVPDENNERLDVAEEELEAHNWHFKVVGGGLFGVVVKSHWTVCETRPAGGTSAPANTTIRLIVARACP